MGMTFEVWAGYASSEQWVVTTDGVKVSTIRSYSAPNDHDPCANDHS